MAGSPVIVFAGLALLLAIFQPAAADLDIFFYDDGASGMAVKMVGSLDLTPLTVVTFSTCTVKFASSAYSYNCLGPASMPAFQLDRPAGNVLPVTSFTYHGSFDLLPRFAITTGFFYIDSAFDDIEISVIDHLPGVDVATVRVCTALFAFHFLVSE